MWIDLSEMPELTVMIITAITVWYLVRKRKRLINEIGLIVKIK